MTRLNKYAPLKPSDVRTVMGVRVLYCGHQGWFIADLLYMGNICVVRANGAVNPDNIVRVDLHDATHHLVDFPISGFWKPVIGVFVVPKEQVRLLRKGSL